MDEPTVKRAVSFFDGQNLYQRAKNAFGYYHPNYDPLKLAEAVCAANGWERRGVRFYTGMPSQAEDPMWSSYWANRSRAMSRAGILVYSRPLVYQQVEIPTEDGSTSIKMVPHEKGIDVRLALDVVRLTLGNQLDVAILFSQDQDLSELASEIRQISRSADRWVKVVSAYPDSPTASPRRGINGTDWVPIDKASYDACLDPRDYRPKKAFSP
jgi:uncharacterized LabA/DUF88 family protein